MMKSTILLPLLVSLIPATLAAPISNTRTTVHLNATTTITHNISTTHEPSVAGSRDPLTSLMPITSSTARQHRHSATDVYVIEIPQVTPPSKAVVFHHFSTAQPTARHTLSRFMTKASHTTDVESSSLFYRPAIIPPSILFLPTTTFKVEPGASAGSEPDTLTTSAAVHPTQGARQQDIRKVHHIALVCIVSSVLIFLSGILVLLSRHRTRTPPLINDNSYLGPSRPLTHGEWCAGTEEPKDFCAGIFKQEEGELFEAPTSDGMLDKNLLQRGPSLVAPDFSATTRSESPLVSSLELGGFAMLSKNCFPDTLGISTTGIMAEVSAAFALTDDRIVNTLRNSTPSPIFFSSPSVAVSAVSSARPPQNPSQVQPTVSIQSVRGSIEEHFSMISCADHFSASGSIRDSKGPRTTKSPHSFSSLRTRFSHHSSRNSHKERKSTFFSVAETPNSSVSRISQDVAVLFSGSEESIIVGIPPAPPPSSNEISAPPKIEEAISTSPMPFPAELLTNSAEFTFEPTASSTPPPLPQKMVNPLQPEPQDISAAIRLSLLFDPSLNLLPPASPSSDGVMASSANSVLSGAKSAPGPSPPRSSRSLNSSNVSPDLGNGSVMLTHPSRGFGDPRTSPSSSGASSPEKQCAMVFAQISKSSLDLEAAIKALESDYDGTPPATPKYSPAQSTHFACLNPSPSPPHASLPVITVSPSPSFSAIGDMLPSEKTSVVDISDSRAFSQSSDNDHLRSGESSLTAVDDSMTTDSVGFSSASHSLKMLQDVPAGSQDESFRAPSMLNLSTSIGEESTLSSDPSTGEIQSFCVSKLFEARAVVIGPPPDARLVQSVIPVLDPEMIQLDEWMKESASEDLGSDDDCDKGSFEGLPEHTSAIHLAQTSQAFMALGDYWASWTYDDSLSRDPGYEVTYSDNRENEDNVYGGVAYPSDEHPLSVENRIRASEVAFRALEREGRYTEGESLIRRLEGLRTRTDRSIPMVSSPLRFESRVSALSVAGSERSVYSQRSENVDGFGELPS